MDVHRLHWNIGPNCGTGTYPPFFSGGYLDQIKGTSLLPENEVELETLLACILRDKAVYELGYELNNRPEWVVIPIRGIRYLLESTEKSRKGSEKES
jgi:predicted trehalose synthase